MKFKVMLPLIMLIILQGFFGNVFAAECASWMNCNGGTRTVGYIPGNTQLAYYTAGSAKSSANADDSGVWRDEYAPYDPRLMPNIIKPTGSNLFVFSPRMRQWGAYNGQGQLVAFGRANGGDHYCSDLNEACKTPRGMFRVYKKGSADCISRTFPLGKGGAKMPYCMFFHNGYSIHGSPYLSLHNGSHGCIRVTIESAQWLFYNFMNYGTRVLVLSY